jgi:hypothetical protein
VLAPAKVSAALGTKGYLVVTAVGAAANAIEGGVQVTQAVEAGRKGHWGVAALHGAGAALRFSAATGLVLEATKAAGSARAVNGQGEVAAKPDAIRSPSTGAVEIADAVSDKTIQEFYEAAASSPVFKRKLDLANLLSGGRRVTVDEILLELQKNSKFIRIENLGGARIDPLANGTFVFQHSTHTGVFSRATAHHELLHLAQFLRDPSLKVSASQMSFLARQAYEPVPALIGSPEIFGAPTLIVSGQVVYLVYESAGLVFKMLSD